MKHVGSKRVTIDKKLFGWPFG